MFIWILNPPNIQDEAAYISLIEKTINAQLPDPQNDSELFELVRLTKFILILELAGNTTRMNVAFLMVDFLQRRQLLQNQLILKLAKIKQEILASRKAVLGKVKNHIDDNLNPSKVNVVDPTKDF